jgi:hypothetical protein
MATSRDHGVPLINATLSSGASSSMGVNVSDYVQTCLAADGPQFRKADRAVKDNYSGV